MWSSILPEEKIVAYEKSALEVSEEERRQVFERAENLKQLLGEEAATLPELALRFCLSQDAVSTVIPGMRRVATVEANAAASDFVLRSSSRNLS